MQLVAITGKGLPPELVDRRTYFDLLVDYMGRLFRQGKASISAKLAGIFGRLGFDRS
jgi:hypothetical protein